MKSLRLFSIFAISTSLLVVAVWADRFLPASKPSKLSTDPSKVKAAYSQLPVYFEPNQGQADSRVKFLCRGLGYNLFLTDTESVLVLEHARSNSKKTPIGLRGPRGLRLGRNDHIKREVVRLQLEGAQTPSAIEGLDKLQGVSNYFIGKDPRQWHSNVSQYARVRLKNIYPGVDVVYYGNFGKLEHDFIVSPGVDPSCVRFALKGVKETHLDAEGNLVLKTACEQFSLKAPLVYQQLDGHRKIVRSQYHLAGQQVVFSVSDYDKKYPLVIDPVLDYSTYLSGSNINGDRELGLAVDGSGDVYISGSAISTNFPTTAGVYQSTDPMANNYHVYVAKFDPTQTGANSLIYSTYLGGSGTDDGNGIAVDSSNNAYVIGETTSSNYPTTGGAYQTANWGVTNAFVTKLNPTGSSLVYSTYLGGSAVDDAINIALDSSNNAYVCGQSTSTDFPTTAGAFQTTNNQSTGFGNGFITKVNSTGTGLIFSTYLGGAGPDIVAGITVDSSDNVYVAGSAYSTNFPTTSGAFQTANSGFYDGFVTKLNPAGTALIYSTYLGGGSLDYAFRVVVDVNGYAYVTGYSSSSNFPTTAGAYRTTFPGAFYGDAYVVKLNLTGTGLVYSTWLGGNSSNSGDTGDGLAIDGNGDVYLTGTAASSNFPTTAGAYKTTATSTNAYLTEINPTGSGLIYSTYLGGSSTDYGNGLALDSSGNVYVGGEVSSTDFPTTSGAYQSTKMNAGSYGDSFVTKFDRSIFLTATPTPTNTPNCCTAGWAEAPGIFPNISQVAIDYSRNVGYVLTSGSVSIFSLSTGAITGVIGTGGQFTNTCLTMGSSGYLFVSHVYSVEKVDPATGVVVATLPLSGSSNVPEGAFEAPNGDLYVTGTTNVDNLGVVFRYVYTAPNTYNPVLLTLGTAVSDACGIVKVGNNLFVSSNLGGPAYMLWESVVGSNNYNNFLTLPTGALNDWRPGQITTDLAGNVFMADENNDGYFVYNPNGTLKYACQPSLSQVPFGIGVDASGNVYMSDAVNIRMFQILGSCNSEPSLTPTAQSTSTATATPSSTNTLGPTGTSTSTATVTNTQTVTFTATVTNTATETNTITYTSTPLNTATVTNTQTVTNTPTDTSTATTTSSVTDTPTVTATPITNHICSPYPNPVTSAAGQISFCYSVIKPCVFHWAVYTLSFRKIYDQRINVTTGGGTMTWNLRDKNGYHTANGLYYLKAEIIGDGGENPIEKISKILVLQ